MSQNASMNGRGERIRAERQRRGWAQEDLARRAGVSRTTVSELEGGHSRATTRLLDIAKALNVTPQWLETGKGPKEPVPAPENTYISAESLEDLARKLVDKGNDDIAKLWQLVLSIKDQAK